MKMLPALRRAATEDHMTSSGTALIPLTLLSDPTEWPKERRRDALLIGDPGRMAGGGCGRYSGGLAFHEPACGGMSVLYT